MTKRKIICFCLIFCSFSNLFAGDFTPGKLWKAMDKIARLQLANGLRQGYILGLLHVYKIVGREEQETIDKIVEKLNDITIYIYLEEYIDAYYALSENTDNAYFLALNYFLEKKIFPEIGSQ
jgi:hypothetical protein